MSPLAADVPWDALTNENIALLSKLIQFDTTNPPGNETDCLRWVQAELAKDGIDSQLIESAPGRGNLVARLKASGEPEGAALLLMAHVDVVPADDPVLWEQLPFGGAVVDGQVWGRGALDMKGTVATWLVLFKLLHRLGQPLRRDLVLMLNADEETGGDYGAGWMAEHHWDLIECEVALNEGGGSTLNIDDRVFYTYAVDEKRPARFTMTARGTPGHASVPKADNAVVHLARAVQLIGTTRLPVRIEPAFEACVRTLAAQLAPEKGAALLRALDPEQTDAALDQAIADPVLRERIRALARDTMSPTILQAGAKINSIPATAQAQVDCRILPSSSAAEVRPQLEALLAEHGLADAIELIFFERPRRPSSPVSHPLIDTLQAALLRHAPDTAGLLPLLTGGATDSRAIRAHGVPAYGFYPVLPSVDGRGVHAPNERVPIEQIAFATRVLGEAVLGYCLG